MKWSCARTVLNTCICIIFKKIFSNCIVSVNCSKVQRGLTIIKTAVYITGKHCILEVRKLCFYLIRTTHDKFSCNFYRFLIIKIFKSKIQRAFSIIIQYRNWNSFADTLTNSLNILCTYKVMNNTLSFYITNFTGFSCYKNIIISIVCIKSAIKSRYAFTVTRKNCRAHS